MRKRLLIALLMVVIVIAGTACWLMGHGEQRPLEDLSLTEAMHSVYYAPQYVALHNNYFTDQGLNVHLQVAAGDAAGAAMLSTCQAEISLFSVEQAVLAMKQGDKLAPTAFALLCQRDGSSLIARSPEPAGFDWQTLSGKAIIGGEPAHASRLALDASLRERDVLDAQVLDNVARSSAARVFANGTGDYVQTLEPDTTALVEAGVGYLAASLAGQARRLPLAAYHTTAQMIKEKPEVLQRFANAITQAQRWMQSQPALEVAKAITPSFPGTELVLLASAVEHYRRLGVWATTPVIEPELVEHLQQLMIVTDRLERAVSSEQLLNSTFAARAVESAK